MEITQIYIILLRNAYFSFRIIFRINNLNLQIFSRVPFYMIYINKSYIQINILIIRSLFIIVMMNINDPIQQNSKDKEREEQIIKNTDSFIDDAQIMMRKSLNQSEKQRNKPYDIKDQKIIESIQISQQGHSKKEKRKGQQNNIRQFTQAWKSQSNLSILIIEKLSLIVNNYFKMLGQMAQRNRQIQILIIYNKSLMEILSKFEDQQRKILQKLKTMQEFNIKIMKQLCSIKKRSFNQPQPKVQQSIFAKFSLTDFKYEPPPKQQVKQEQNYKNKLLQLFKNHLLQKNEHFIPIIRQKMDEVKKKIDDKRSLVLDNKFQELNQLLKQVQQYNEGISVVTNQSMFDLYEMKCRIKTQIKNLNLQIEVDQEKNQRQFVNNILKIQAGLQKMNENQLQNYLRKQRQLRKKLKKQRVKEQQVFLRTCQQVQAENIDLKKDIFILKQKLLSAQQKLNRANIQIDYLKTMKQRRGNKSTLVDQSRFLESQSKILSSRKNYEQQIKKLKQQIQKYAKQFEQKRLIEIQLETRRRFLIQHAKINNMNIQQSHNILQIFDILLQNFVDSNKVAEKVERNQKKQFLREQELYSPHLQNFQVRFDQFNKDIFDDKFINKHHLLKVQGQSKKQTNQIQIKQKQSIQQLKIQQTKLKEKNEQMLKQNLQLKKNLDEAMRKYQQSTKQSNQKIDNLTTSNQLKDQTIRQLQRKLDQVDKILQKVQKQLFQTEKKEKQLKQKLQAVPNVQQFKQLQKKINQLESQNQSAEKLSSNVIKAFQLIMDKDITSENFLYILDQMLSKLKNYIQQYKRQTNKDILNSDSVRQVQVDSQYKNLAKNQQKIAQNYNEKEQKKHKSNKIQNQQALIKTKQINSHDENWIKSFKQRNNDSVTYTSKKYNLPSQKLEKQQDQPKMRNKQLAQMQQSKIEINKLNNAKKNTKESNNKNTINNVISQDRHLQSQQKQKLNYSQSSTIKNNQKQKKLSSSVVQSVNSLNHQSFIENNKFNNKNFELDSQKSIKLIKQSTARKVEVQMKPILVANLDKQLEKNKSQSNKSITFDLKSKQSISSKQSNLKGAILNSNIVPNLMKKNSEPQLGSSKINYRFSSDQQNKFKIKQISQKNQLSQKKKGQNVLNQDIQEYSDSPVKIRISSPNSNTSIKLNSSNDKQKVNNTIIESKKQQKNNNINKPEVQVTPKQKINSEVVSQSSLPPGNGVKSTQNHMNNKKKHEYQQVSIKPPQMYQEQVSQQDQELKLQKQLSILQQRHSITIQDFNIPRNNLKNINNSISHKPVVQNSIAHRSSIPANNIKNRLDQSALRVGVQPQYVQKMFQKFQRLNNHADTLDFYQLYQRYKQALKCLQKSEQLNRLHQIRYQRFIESICAEKQVDPMFSLQQQAYLLIKKVRQQQALLNHQKQQFQNSFNKHILQSQMTIKQTLKLFRKKYQNTIKIENEKRVRFKQ